MPARDRRDRWRQRDEREQEFGVERQRDRAEQAERGAQNHPAAEYLVMRVEQAREYQAQRVMELQDRRHHQTGATA